MPDGYSTRTFSPGRMSSHSFYQAACCLLALCCLRQGLGTEAVPWYWLVVWVLCPHEQDLLAAVCAGEGTNQDGHLIRLLL